MLLLRGCRTICGNRLGASRLLQTAPLLRITQHTESVSGESKHSTYVCPKFNDSIGRENQDASAKPLLRLRSLYDDILTTFLPKGYPNSVSEGYAQYAAYHFLSILFTSSSGVLSMQALLYGVGLGAGSIPMAAALNWVIKDGLGQLGGVLFASMVNNKFDVDPKRWRFIASLAMECSSLIEFMTPIFPQYFLPIASVANIGKNISFLAASASRAAINNSFAVNENLADVTARSGSQSIFGSTLGTGLGVGIAAMLSNDYSSTLMAFLACSTAGLISLHLSLRSIVLHALSADKLLYTYCKYRVDYFESIKLGRNTNDIRILSPKEVSGEASTKILFQLPMKSAVEAIMASSEHLHLRHVEAHSVSMLSYSSRLCPISIGDDLDKVFPPSYTNVADHFSMFSRDGYIIKVKFTDGFKGGSVVHVLYKKGASVADIMRSYIHAFEMQLLLCNENNLMEAHEMIAVDSRSDKFDKNIDLEFNKIFIERARLTLTQRDFVHQRAPNSTSTGFVDRFINSMVGNGNESVSVEGMVTGSTIGWHLNPLLLEPKYARISLDDGVPATSIQ